MTSAAASVTFRLNQPSQSHSLKSKPHFTFPFKPLLTFSPLHKHPKLQIAAKSTDVRHTTGIRTRS
ncbi:hypothetical protein HanRHA438_Chr13g0626881 [Helianthus annuus]|nr:hypothetical protein HanRHA438_Chr13g0626881 [Helianthus annuus]